MNLKKKSILTHLANLTNAPFLFLCVQGQEYAKYFLLEYQREDSGHWIRFRNRESSEVSNVSGFRLDHPFALPCLASSTVDWLDGNGWLVG